MSEVLFTVVSLGRPPPSRGVCVGAGGWGGQVITLRNQLKAGVMDY